MAYSGAGATGARHWALRNSIIRIERHCTGGIICQPIVQVSDIIAVMLITDTTS